tara:strand:- start:4434 stop:6464 length:2031 start_codon:yes stop_codon:yes gene_type:complete
MNPEQEPTQPHQPKRDTDADLLRQAMATPPGQWEPVSAEELDRFMPDYTVEKILGRGGMGAVYQGIQISLKRPVAIKVLPPELGQDLEFEARFRREAQSMARLNHPNIIQIFDFGQTEGGHYFFVMEFVEGGDLHSLIREGHVQPETALKVVIQICEALHYAHSKGYVHRDIKPANILLNEEGVVKVGDFGLAKLVDPKQGSETEQLGITLTGISMGTPNYVAPEQMSGTGEVDHRADIYSLGVMLYEMLTGEIPRGHFAPPSGKIQVDVRIDDVVLKAMEEKPERRYQSAKDVESDVTVIRSNPKGKTIAGMEKNGKKVRSGGKSGSKRAVLGFGAALLAATLAVSGLIWKPWENVVLTETSAQLTLELPPALAAMKERGGRLRAWTSDGEPLDLTQAEGVDDLQRLFFAPTSWQYKAASASGLIYKTNRTLRLPDPASWSDFFVVSREGTILPFSGTPTPPDFEALRNSVAKARAVNSADGRLIFVTDQGRIKIAFADSTDAPVWRDEMIRKLEALEDIVAVDSKGDFSAFLAQDGSVSLWNFNTGEFTELTGQSIVEVAVGAMFALALDRDGVPHALLAPGATFDHSGAQIPTDLPKVYAIRAYGRGAAAQLEDGSWRAWGKNHWQRLGNPVAGAGELFERIEALGPAVDIEFKVNSNNEQEQATLLWIEPVK